MQRTSLPTAGGVQQARVDTALRELAEGASEGLPPGWSKVVRGATIAHVDRLADELDQAVATTDLAMDRGQGWWKVITVVQWLFFIAAVVGGLVAGMPMDRIVAAFGGGREGRAQGQIGEEQLAGGGGVLAAGLGEFAVQAEQPQGLRQSYETGEAVRYQHPQRAELRPPQQVSIVDGLQQIPEGEVHGDAFQLFRVLGSEAGQFRRLLPLFQQRKPVRFQNFQVL